MLLVSIFIFDNILWPSGVSTGCSFSFSETLFADLSFVTEY